MVPYTLAATALVVLTHMTNNALHEKNWTAASWRIVSGILPKPDRMSLMAWPSPFPDACSALNAAMSAGSISVLVNTVHITALMKATPPT